MDRKSVGNFKFFTGIESLAQIATRDDRVCVLNILGGESSEVTPVGHAWSGGNVVFGTSPGRKGQVLETPAGNIPVYNNVREGLEDGHRFNCGVVYLPPSAADDGVVELIRVNPDLTKIFIPTEKMSVHDAREIRAMAQQRGIDIFGGNSWGVLHHTGDVWHAIRNAAARVKPGGLFYIALYSADVRIDPPPQFWLDVKREYVSAGWLKRWCMDLWYVWRFDLGRNLFNLPKFVIKLKKYKQMRGMSVFTDIRDWLGGWPMEFVYDADAIKACEEHGLTLEKISTGEANTEFLFVRKTTP